MITAFKVLLMIVIALTVIGLIAESSSEQLRNQMTAICITAIISLVVAFAIL